MSTSDMRKHRRYKSKVPILFSDRITGGILLDASREGAMIVMETNESKPIGAYISFEAIIQGPIPFKEITNHEIPINKLFKKSNEKNTIEKEPTKSVRLSAQVVRHTQYKGRNAMGLKIMELNADDLMTWLSFIGDIKTKQEVLPFGTASANNRKKEKDAPGFTIRFQDEIYLKKFLPAEPTGSFFIPTKKLQDKDSKIRLTLVHPRGNKLLQVEGVVRSSCNGEIDNTSDGILCTFSSLTKELIKKLNNFLDEPYYQNQ